MVIFLDGAMTQPIRSHPHRRRKRQTLDFTGASALRMPRAAPPRAPLVVRLSPLLAAVAIAIAIVGLAAP